MSVPPRPEGPPRPVRFSTALLGSLGLHGLLLLSFERASIREWSPPPDIDSRIEIDLTRPFRLTDDPSLARRAEVSGKGAAPVERPSPGGGAREMDAAPTDVPAGVEPSPPDAPREWVLPGPSTDVLTPAPADSAPAGGSGEGDGPGLGGFGDGGGGEVDWVHLTELPRILNRDELAAALRRFYPEDERKAGREADVLLDVRLGTDGKVLGMEVAESAGALFDAAAQRALSLARFSPAKVGTRAVTVKIRQTIAFRLD